MSLSSSSDESSNCDSLNDGTCVENMDEVFANEIVGDFETSIVSKLTLNTIGRDNKYVRSIVTSTDFHVLKPKVVIDVFNVHGCLGLFHLFITKSFIKNCILYWTNDKLIKI